MIVEILSAERTNDGQRVRWEANRNDRFEVLAADLAVSGPIAMAGMRVPESDLLALAKAPPTVEQCIDF